ncbi:MAG: VCBS repeat-containing protein, partial [Acidobacteriota bacterium]
SWGLFSTDFADLDGDGDLDIGSMGFGASDGLQVYLNQGDGSWKRSFGFIGGNSDHVFVFGDVNNDGHADIATAKQEGTVWLGDGEGFFTVADGNLPELPAFGTRDGPSLGDVDHDGRDDLAFCSEEANAEVWLSRGDGTWEDVSATIPQTGQCQHTQLHDMNGDGHLDAVTFGSGNVYVYGGDGHGQSWSTLAHFTTPDSPGSSRCFRVGGDVDHNGRADMVLVNTKQLSLFDTRNIKHAYREASMAQELSIRIVQPGAGRRLHAGSAAFIDWAAEVPLGSTATVSLELSTSGPAGSWMPIATSVPNSGRHQWIVPAAFSDACHLRLTLDTGSSQASVVSPSRFEIARRPDPLSLRISAAGELSWDDALDRVRFNLYRGDWQQFLQTGMYTQAPDSVPDAARWCDLEETTQADPLAPPAGLLVYYLVTGYREMEDGQQPGVPVPMAEGVLGQRTDAVTRANAHPCPPRPLPP